MSERVSDERLAQILADFSTTNDLGKVAKELQERRAASPTISAEIYQQDWIPGFAAFRDDGAVEEGKAHIIINIGAFLGTVATGDVPAAELPYFIAESLMHEMVHAFEAWAKVEFSEEKVEALIEKYRAASAENQGGQ